jgi:hypothetical protein
VLSDGVRRVVVGCDVPAVDVSGKSLAALALKPPRDFAGSIKPQVRAARSVSTTAERRHAM